MIVTDIIAAFVGFSAGLFVGKLYSVKKHTDAYESGWSQGYEIGLEANKPKRVKKIRKADL